MSVNPKANQQRKLSMDPDLNGEPRAPSGRITLLKPTKQGFSSFCCYYYYFFFYYYRYYHFFYYY